MPNLKQFGFLKENWLCIKSNFSRVGEEEANWVVTVDKWDYFRWGRRVI